MSTPNLVEYETEPDISKTKNPLSKDIKKVETKIKKISPVLVKSSFQVRMKMMARHGSNYVMLGQKDVNIAKDDTFTYNGIGQYIIDLEGNPLTDEKGNAILDKKNEQIVYPTVAYYEDGKPVCHYNIEENRPLSTIWTWNNNSRSARFTKKIFADKTLEIILKVAKSSTGMQIMNIIIGAAIAGPVCFIIGTYVHIQT
jgi:hypothetical protein